MTDCTRRRPVFFVALIVCLVSLLPVRVSTGQAVPPETFTEALALFDAGRFADAALAFDRVGEADWAEAATVMRAKSLYRGGQYEAARSAYEAFLDRFPESRYAGDARTTLSFVQTALAQLADRPATLGVVLSLSGSEAAQAQSLFNGLRMAVEEHNETATGRNRIRMVFRDIGGDPTGARGAVQQLADEGATVVIGALFSDQAREAAAAAESRRIVFVAPLATDYRVSNGRRYVFQANPTIETRGRLMARFAMNGLLIRRFGIISGVDPQGVSEGMALAFEDEARSLGGEVVFHRQLESTSDWYRFGSVVSADTLGMVRGLYVPVSGGPVERIADAVLQGLERSGSTVRLLGNAEWNGLPMVVPASKFGVTYTNDFHVDRSVPATDRFLRTYRSRYDVDAGRLAHVGYDVTRFVLDAARSVHEAALVADALRDAPAFEGTGIRIDFRGGQVNEAMFYHRYRDGRDELIR